MVIKQRVTLSHIDKLTTRTKYDPEENNLIATVQLESRVSPDTIRQLLQLQVQPGALYVVVGSLQGVMSLDEDEATRPEEPEKEE